MLTKTKLTEEQLLEKLGGCLVLQAARILGLTRPTVANLITERKIKPLGQIGGTWILDRAEIEAMAKSRRR
jgi:Helix-turn-helix domain